MLLPRFTGEIIIAVTREQDAARMVTEVEHTHMGQFVRLQLHENMVKTGDFLEYSDILSDRLVEGECSCYLGREECGW